MNHPALKIRDNFGMKSPRLESLFKPDKPEPCIGCKSFNLCRDDKRACANFYNYCQQPIMGNKLPKSDYPSRGIYIKLFEAEL